MEAPVSHTVGLPHYVLPLLLDGHCQWILTYFYGSHILYLFQVHFSPYDLSVTESLISFVFITIELQLTGKMSCSHLLFLQRTFLCPALSPTFGVIVYSGFIFYNPVPSGRLFVLS